MSFDLADFSYSRQRSPTHVVALNRNFTIKVRSQIIGLPVDRVKMVFHIEKLTAVPLAPREIAGLANLRGRIVTALHLDRCLRIDQNRPQSGKIAVVVDHNGEDYALLVDETGDVVISAEGDAITRPAHIDQRISELLAACYRYEDGILSILDIGALIRRVSRKSEESPHDAMARITTVGANP